VCCVDSTNVLIGCSYNPLTNELVCYNVVSSGVVRRGLPHGCDVLSGQLAVPSRPGHTAARSLCALNILGTINLTHYHTWTNSISRFSLVSCLDIPQCSWTCSPSVKFALFCDWWVTLAVVITHRMTWYTVWTRVKQYDIGAICINGLLGHAWVECQHGIVYNVLDQRPKKMFNWNMDVF